MPERVAERRPDRTLGGHHDEFWQHCANGQLRVQACAQCGERTWPVVAHCDHCGGTDLRFVKLTGRGRIISWATFERDYYGGLLPMPWETILVALEDGPLFISNPIGFDHKDVVPNMPVRVAFIDAVDGEGAFRLPVFEHEPVD